MSVLKYWDAASSSYKTLSGPAGPAGPGVPIAGTTGQVLTKTSNTDLDTSWTGPMLPLTGGTLTGNLAITPAAGAPILALDSPASGTGRQILGRTAGSTRWQIVPGNGAAESGANVGSDFLIQRYTDAGVFIDAPLSINRASGAVTARGTQTNDSATAGMVGEVISSNVTSPVALTTSTIANVTSISLTAGDWDVSGEVWYSVGTGGATLAACGINTASVTLPSLPALGTTRTYLTAALAASSVQALPLRPCRASLSATTTYYLVAMASFPSSTCNASGNIIARRVR